MLNQMTRARRPIRPIQPPLPFRPHGGRRNGAGRKKDTTRNLVEHTVRPAVSSREPAHVTLRMCKGVWNLRTRRCFRMIEQALRAARRAHDDTRFVHYSVLGNHIHLIIEARDRSALARRVQGLEIRIARALHRVMERGGRVFADRYHVHVLRSPREVRNALAYVMRNAAQHYGERGVDPFSSGKWFDGFRGEPHRRPSACLGRSPPVDPAGSWLLRRGWRAAGLIPLP